MEDIWSTWSMFIRTTWVSRFCSSSLYWLLFFQHLRVQVNLLLNLIYVNWLEKERSALLIQSTSTHSSFAFICKCFLLENVKLEDQTRKDVAMIYRCIMSESNTLFSLSEPENKFCFLVQLLNQKTYLTIIITVSYRWCWFWFIRW